MNPAFRLLCWRLYLDAYVDVGVSYQQKPFIRTGVSIWLCLCNNSSFDFQGKKINQGTRSLSKLFVPIFFIIVFGHLAVAVAACAVHGRQLENLEGHFKVERGQMLSYGRTPALNATFFDPCLNLCLDQAGIKNTISQTSYLSFFLQVKVKEKGKSTCFQQALMLNPNQLHCCHYCFHIDFLASLN